MDSTAIFRNTYVCKNTNMCARTINEKVHKFEGERGWVYRIV